MLTFPVSIEYTVFPLTECSPGVVEFPSVLAIYRDVSWRDGSGASETKGGQDETPQELCSVVPFFRPDSCKFEVVIEDNEGLALLHVVIC